MTRLKSRSSIPFYARDNAIQLSRQQFWTIAPRLNKRTHPLFETGQRDILVTQLRDGTYWAEWRGQAVWWMNRWYEIPKVVGERAFKIKGFIDEMMEAS